MRRTGLLVALAVVLSIAIPAATPAPAAAHTCTLQPDRPWTFHIPPGPGPYIGGHGYASCTQSGFLRMTLSLQHYSTTLGWYTWASNVVETNGTSIDGYVSYSGCHTGGWRLKLTLFARTSSTHSHTQTLYSLTHWSGC